MHFKHLSLLALASLVSAQTTKDLNATLTSAPNLTNLTTLLRANPALLSTLAGAKDITILAPSDEALTELLNSDAGKALASDPDRLAAVLTYHVLNGTFHASDITNTSAFVPTLLTNSSYTNVTGGQIVQALVIDDDVVFYTGLLHNATVTQADLNFTGGVIHIIDSVLTIPSTVLETALAANLTALYGAINATDLIATVNETPDITIFAPNNDAFQAIASGLQNASKEDIADILKYHVVVGTVAYSSLLENGTQLTTANGQNLTITFSDDGFVFVNGAEVVLGDVLVANGVVHVIDNVLNPSATTGPSPSATAGVPAFSGASSASNVPYTSGQPTPSTTLDAGTPEPAATSSQATGAAMPLVTGAVGFAALFGAAGAAAFVGY